MSYTHYGKQAEVWKHLALCAIINQEKPTVYVETNAAYADYSLSRTPEQEYGIYLFLEKAHLHDEGRNSCYFKLANDAVQTNRYIGSPGLAMSILKYNSHYIFFDLDGAALSNIKNFSIEKGVREQVEMHNEDSIQGGIMILPNLPQSTLVHIDPYSINEPNDNGDTYLDLFAEAARRSLRCFMWYGYQTLDEKEHLEQLIKDYCHNLPDHSISCHELTMNIIERNSMLCTPGVLGSGLLTANLSQSSRDLIAHSCDLLTEFYQNAVYKEFDGTLFKDVIL